MDQLITEVGTATINPFVKFFEALLEIIPGLIGALIVVAIGYLFAYFVGCLVKHALQKAGLEKWIVKKELTKTILNIKLSVLVGQLVKWGIFIWFLVPATELINLAGFALIIRSLALWIPKLILAIVVLIFGVILAKIVSVEIHNKGNKMSQVISKIVQITLIVVFFNISLNQIGIATSLIENIILLILGTILLVIAIVIGISFGIAGKKYADHIIEEYLIKKKIKKK
jgi:hypothetical protein